MKKIFLPGIFFFFSNFTNAQFSLLIERTDKEIFFNNISINYKKNFPSENEREKELNSFLLSLYEQGFLTASIDSLKKDSINLIAYFHWGDYYQWAEIRKGNVDDALLSEIGFRDKLYRNEPINPQEIKLLMEKILGYCENHGHPFASVKLDSLEISEDNDSSIIRSSSKISASLNLTKNKLYLTQ